MRLAICGPGEAGKDEAGDIIASLTDLRYKCGTSKFAAEIVWKVWGKHQGYLSVDECWRDRRNHRQVWASIIGDYNREDPVALYRYCLKEQDILTGLRFKHEMLACKDAGLCDLWIWLDRKGVPDDKTMEYGPFECDITIDNNGTLADLREKLRRLCRVLGILKEEVMIYGHHV